MFHLPQFAMHLLYGLDIILAACILRHSFLVWYHWKHSGYLILTLHDLSNRLMKMWKLMMLVAALEMAIIVLTGELMVSAVLAALYLMAPATLEIAYRRRRARV